MKKTYVISIIAMLILIAAYFAVSTMSAQVITDGLESEALIAAVQRKIDLTTVASIIMIPFLLLSAFFAVAFFGDKVAQWKWARKLP